MHATPILDAAIFRERQLVSFRASGGAASVRERQLIDTSI